MASEGQIGSPPIIIPDGKLYSGEDFTIPPICAPYVKGILIPGGWVRDRVEKMASDIRNHYKQRELHIVCLLKGAQTFFGTLSNFIYEQEYLTDCEGVELFHHFLHICTYKNGVACRQAKLIAEELPCVKNKDVLVIDDVVESGNTLQYVARWLTKFEPKSIRVAGLVQVRIPKNPPIVDFVGFTAPPEWLVGYGIDFNDRFRGLPHICVLSEAGKKALAV